MAIFGNIKIRSFLSFALFCLSLSSPALAEMGTIRIAVLKYGTVSWELDVIRHHGLDKSHGFKLAITELASTQATKVALQAGAADIIVTDWLFVSRQNWRGFDFSFVPFSSASGALMVRDGSKIKGIPDLKGKKIGVAGGPLDKSWLFLNAYVAQTTGMDLKASTQPVFGAPPLLNQLAIKGEVDAILNFWHYSARLESHGFRRLVEIGDVQRALTKMKQPAAIIGYTFSQKWAKNNPKVLEGFLRAANEARRMLLSSDKEWERLEPLLKAGSDAVKDALKSRYREGIPVLSEAAQQRASMSLYKVLSRFGGTALVGENDGLAPGVFWKSQRENSMKPSPRAAIATDD